MSGGNDAPEVFLFQLIVVRGVKKDTVYLVPGLEGDLHRLLGILHVLVDEFFDLFDCHDSNLGIGQKIVASGGYLMPTFDR